MSKNIFEILREIEQTSSRNDKESILTQHKDNEMLKVVLYFVYNPFIVSGLSTKKINKKISLKQWHSINSLEDMMMYLTEHNTGTDINIKSVQEFINNQPEEEQEILKQIATKELKIGMTAKSINKVIKDFIPEFNVMLAEKYFDYEEKLKGEFIVTEKLDGIRCVFIKENGYIKVFSRQGQPIMDLVDVMGEIKLLPDNMVYDGELLLTNSNSLNSADLYRETVKVVRKDGIKRNVIFYMFDIIPIEEFKKGKSVDCCLTRKNSLHDLLSFYDFKWIKEVSMLYVGNDKSQIMYWLNKMIDSNKEGVMGNICDGKYECKRTQSILKVKKMHDIDARVIGFEEGEGLNKGTLGRINIEYKGNVVGVGSGFALKESNNVPLENTRDYIWNNQDRFINKIAKIQYFEETTNSKDDKVSLRFPVFIEWRWDKDEPSFH